MREREHNPNHIPTKIGNIQKILDENDPLLVEVLMRKDLNGIEEMIKREKKHKEISISLNKSTVDIDQRLLVMEAMRQLYSLKEALKMMDELAEKDIEKENQTGFTLI